MSWEMTILVFYLSPALCGSRGNFLAREIDVMLQKLRSSILTPAVAGSFGSGGRTMYTAVHVDPPRSYDRKQDGFDANTHKFGAGGGRVGGGLRRRPNLSNAAPA